MFHLVTAISSGALLVASASAAATSGSGETQALASLPVNFKKPSLATKLSQMNKGSLAASKAVDETSSVKRIAKGGKGKGKGKGKWKDRIKKKRNGWATFTYEDEENYIFQRNVFPIGSCYETQPDASSSIESEEALSLEIYPDHFEVNLRVWANSSTCEGNYEDVVISEGLDPMEVDHEKSKNKALKLPKWANYGGRVDSVYYTENGCTGTPASYFITANGCMTLEDEETDDPDDVYSLNFACNQTDNSIDIFWFANDTCGDDGVLVDTMDGDECINNSEDGGFEYVTSQCAEGDGSEDSPDSPDSPKSPKSPKEPKEPKTVTSRLTELVTSFFGASSKSKKFR